MNRRRQQCPVSIPVEIPLAIPHVAPTLVVMDTEFVPYPDLPWATEDDIRENWDLLVNLTTQFHVTNLRYASSNRVIVTCPGNYADSDPYEYVVVASQAIQRQLRIYTDEVLENERVSQDLLHARALA